MWKDRLSSADLDDAASKIQSLQALGCGILRFAAPDIESAEVLGRLSQMVSMPLCADIHFDYKIALRCMDFPISKIRINPEISAARIKYAPFWKKPLKTAFQSESG